MSGRSGFGRGPVPSSPAGTHGFTPRTARLRLARPDTVPSVPSEWRLEALRLLVGRTDLPATTPDIDLAPADSALPPSVSRRHAELYWHDGRLLLVDLGSTNGTWLNGQRLPTPGLRQPGAAVELKPGDRLRFGAVECEVAAG
jgi:predicted component of type VI protein secretion system